MRKSEHRVQSTEYRIQMIKSLLFLCLILSSVFCLLSSVVFAAGEAKYTFTWKDWFWPIVNFTILVVLLVLLLAKFDIKGFLKKRAEMIEKSLKDAEEAKELAQKALLDVKERLKLHDKEIKEIISAARKSGEKEKEALMKEGEKMAAKLMEQIKANIEYELKTAKEDIKAEAIELAMEVAEKELREKITKELQESLLKESIAKIEAGK